MRLVYRGVLAFGLAGVLLLNAACHSELFVTIFDFGYDPASDVVPGSTDVFWQNDGDTAHTATSTDGFFSTGTLAPGATAQHQFDFAGTFIYRCSIHPKKMRGAIAVRPATSDGQVNTSETFTVFWAFGDGSPPAIPPGFDADIQVRKPGRSRYVNWLTNQTGSQTSGVYDPNKTGRYRFRARYQNTSTGKASDWSPATAVKVTRP